MPRRSTRAFIGVAIGVCAMALTWYLAHDVAALRRVDANVLTGFLSLRGVRSDRIANAIANLCDPMPYVVLAAVPVAIALLRGRPRVAVALLVLLVGANETTELVKPLLTGARDPVATVYLTHSTWPSGHATASMSLAMAMVIGVPARWRPVVGALMAAFCVAIVYSFLLLGWHYPSDVIGGFEMASTWALLAVGGLSLYDARHPVRRTAGGGTPAFSIAGALAPAVLLIACGLGFAALLAVLRPHAVIGYATAHPGFVVAAAVIAGASFALASGMSLLLGAGGLRAGPLSGSGRAPTAAPPSRLPHG